MAALRKLIAGFYRPSVEIRAAGGEVVEVEEERRSGLVGHRAGECVGCVRSRRRSAEVLVH